MFVLDDIALKQLSILGITEEYQFFICSFIVIAILCLCVKPFVLFLHYRHYTIVLTYVISSLLMFILLSLYVFSKGNPAMLKFGLQGIAIFGGCYGLYLLYRFIKYTYSR